MIEMQKTTADNVNITENTTENKKEDRAVWSNSVEFLMSCIAVSVGLGNIWRFPFTAYENGGGAFLIPYIIVLFVIGKPMYYLEMIIGQFTSKSSVKIYNFSPAFKGIAIGQLLATICVITYYCSLIALSIYYMFASFSSELPWSRCLESWGSNCIDSKPKMSSHSNNVSVYSTDTDSQFISSSEVFFSTIVLKEKLDISDGIGYPDWKLTLCLLAAWIVVCLVIIKGVKSSGKAAYFLALFPYVIMITLLIRAVTLEGAVDGIIFFINPQWSELLNPKVWYAATTQVFFSLSVGMGTLIMFASYNRFDHNIYRDAMIVTTLDTFTSLMAGITIFGILGNLAHNLGIEDIGAVVRSGTGLAFISYPDAISKFDVVPQVFSVLFFFMLFVLGIGTVVALQSAVVTVIVDQFYYKYWKVVVWTCIAGFLIGLIYVTPGGQWMLNLVDNYGGTLPIFALAICELVVLFWIYGIENFCWDLQFMTGKNPSLYWRICWTLVTPLLMFVIFVYSMVNLKPLLYSGLVYPDAITAIGWGIFGFCMFQFPFWAFCAYAKKSRKISFLDAAKEVIRPNKYWGPSDPEVYAEWVKFKQDAKEKRIKEAATLGHSNMKQKLYILLGKYRV